MYPTTPTIPYSKQQIALRIHSTDGPLYAKSETAPALDTTTQPAAAPALQCSSQIVRLTCAIIEAQESLGLQAAARDAGKEWAAGEEAPEVLLTSAFVFLALETNDTDFLVSKSYWKVIWRPDLWLPAMEAELKTINNKEVWDVVDAKDVPEGKKIVDCM
ncbi:hypothetical protein C0993_005953 [Termitomyces sp. T159_Od127]|nr:hypothetical protein C0993_005953 [Termitomyces sp. T159_Od127]